MKIASFFLKCLCSAGLGLHIKHPLLRNVFALRRTTENAVAKSLQCEYSATRHQACKMEAVCTILGSNLCEGFNCIYLLCCANVVFLTMVQWLR